MEKSSTNTNQSWEDVDGDCTKPFASSRTDIKKKSTGNDKCSTIDSKNVIVSRGGRQMMTVIRDDSVEVFNNPEKRTRDTTSSTTKEVFRDWEEKDTGWTFFDSRGGNHGENNEMDENISHNDDNDNNEDDSGWGYDDDIVPGAEWVVGIGSSRELQEQQQRELSSSADGNAGVAEGDLQEDARHLF